MRLLLALLLLSFEAGAATKYISPTGTAAWGSCTTRDAPCSLSTAQTSSAAGDEIIMLDGTYSVGLNTATNGTAENYITWRSENNRRAVLDGLASAQTDKTLVVDNNYHRFIGIKVNVQTGPGNANVYGFYAVGTAWEFLDGEITYTGDEATTGAENIIYCAQVRTAGIFEGNTVHNCTYGISVFNTATGFAAKVRENTFYDMIVGDDEDSDCMAVSGAGTYDWTGMEFRDNDCSGYRDDGIDMLIASNALSIGNDIHHPSSYLDANQNSSCVKMGSELSSGNRSERDYCYGLTDDPAMRNYGYVFTGASSAVARSSVVINPYRCADISQRNGAGAANNKLEHMSCHKATDVAVRVYGGATGTEITNSAHGGTVADIQVTAGLTVTGTNNRRITGANDILGTYNQTGDTDGDPAFIGGPNPTTAEGFRPNCLTSPLKDAGTDVGAYQDFTGRYFTGAREIGAYACQGGTPRPTPTARPEITARPDNTARPTADARP